LSVSSSLSSELSSKSPFVFLKARYIVELTGKRASNLQDFLDYLKTANRSSIFYHIYHPLLDSHLVPYEFPNDFSFWFSDALQDKDLAEQVADFDLPESGGLESVRQILLSKIEGALREKITMDVRPGSEFNFLNCRVVVLPTGIIAKNLDELADSISVASELSIFYHMVTSRLFSESRYDDFSSWILENTTDTELAEDIRAIDPTTHVNVKSIQQEVMKMFQRYLRQKNLGRI
jgi:Family of unknown function (DUF5752)